MTNLKRLGMLVFFVLAFGISALGQVTVAGSTGADGSYATLKGAFDAINANAVQTGNAINITITANTTETATAQLNTGDWASVTVRPTGAGRIIEGSIVGAIIRLNGADNVTIDGRVGGVGTNRDLTVRNNNASTATAAIYLSSVAAGNGASNNVIRNLEIACGADQQSLTVSTFGIIQTGTTISTTSTDGNDNDNNQFIFNRIVKVRYGIVSRGVTTNNNLNAVITDNIIGPAAFGSDQLGKVGIYMQADTGATISRNLIQNVGVLVANTAGGADRIGIGIGGESWSVTDSTTITSGDYTVTKNVVQNIIEEKTFSAVGIKLGTTRSGAATNNLVANNFIINVRANGTAGDQFVGIGISGGQGDRVEFNSISITGDIDPAGATASSTWGGGFRIPGANAANNANFSIRNNSIYVDVNSNTAAQHYFAITLNSAAYVFGTGGLDYNNYYINAANPQMRTGGLGTTTTTGPGTEFTDLAAWKLALTTAQDANSIQADPLYLSNTMDLHLGSTSPNINVGLTIAGIAEDIDAQVRPNGANPDIGADEFYALPGTLQLSSATYGGNEGATLVATVNRVLGSTGTVGVTATLTDGSAVGGAACGVGVDYVNPGPQLLSFGDGVTSQPINVTLCTDLVTDAAETFTITLSAPTGGASLGSPTVATATITDVPPPFSGSYNVGTAQTYTSLTNPGGIFEAINLAGATGNVTINIISDLTGENGTVALNEVAGGFSVTIKPSGAPRSITGSSTNSIIRLNGADMVTIDGSLTGATAAGQIGGDAAIRNLTVQNTNTAATAGAVIAVMSGTNGAQNDTVKNVNIIGQAFNQTLIALHMGGNAVGSAGTDNDNNRVENNSFQKAFIGLYNTGASAANQNTGNVVTMNDLSFTGVDRLRRAGMLFFNQDGLQVTLNSIGGITSDEGLDSYGIGLGIQDATTTTTTSGAITNATVSRNKINGVASTSTTGFSSFGIGLAGGTTGPNTISNNMISGVTAPSTSPDNPYGIFIAGVTSSNTAVYFNSISMTGDRGGTSTSQMPSFGIAITGASPVVELKNNIFYNTQTSAIGGVNAKSYSIGMVAAAGTNLSSDFNDFFTSGANSAGWRSGSLAAAAGTDYATLALWTAAIGDDASSKEVDPLYVNPLNDLHLQGTSTLTSMGIAIGAVTNDFDNDPRPAANPDIGADEIVMSTGGVIAGGTYYNVSTAPGDTLGGNVTVTGTIRFLGVLNDGGFTLTIGCGATVTNQGAFNYFTGAVIKDFCGAENFVFPIGTFPDGTTVGNASEYTPVTANVTALGVNPSSLSAQSFDFTLFPFNAATSVDRNWALIETGDITADLSFTYIDGDVNGNESDYRVWWRNVNTPNNLCPGAPCINTGTNTAGPVLGVTQFSRWTVAEALGPVAAMVNLGGRVTLADGISGVSKAQVVLSGAGMQPRIALTNPFGYYNFENLEVGRTYVLTVGSKQYTFMNPTIVVTPDENVSNANFFANP